MPEYDVSHRVVDVEHAQSAHEKLCAERYTRILEIQQRMQDDLNRHRAMAEDSLARMNATLTELTLATAKRNGAQALVEKITAFFAMMLAASLGAVISHFWTATK